MLEARWGCTLLWCLELNAKSTYSQWQTDVHQHWTPSTAEMVNHGNVKSFAGIWPSPNFLDRLKVWPDNGSRWKVRGSPKALRFILWIRWTISVPKFSLDKSVGLICLSSTWLKSICFCDTDTAQTLKQISDKCIWHWLKCRKKFETGMCGLIHDMRTVFPWSVTGWKTGKGS